MARSSPCTLTTSLVTPVPSSSSSNGVTASIKYIPFQVIIFQKSILLIVQYKYSKSCSEDIFSKIQRKSDPPHKIMRYCTYYSTQLASSCPPGRNLPGGNDLYLSCTSFEGWHLGGASPLNIFTWFIGSGGLLTACFHSLNLPRALLQTYSCLDL